MRLFLANANSTFFNSSIRRSFSENKPTINKKTKKFKKLELKIV